jgi:hypothetical protein
MSVSAGSAVAGASSTRGRHPSFSSASADDRLPLKMSDITPTHTPNEAYDPKPTLGNATQSAIISGGVGAFVSTIQNALGTHNRGAAGVFTRTGGTTGFFGASERDFFLWKN